MLENNFRDKDYAPAGFTVLGTPDVKTEIDLFEIGVKGNRDSSEKFCAAELEPDQACVRLAIVGIELRAGRNVFLQARRVTFINHHQKLSSHRRKGSSFITT